jgi:aspartyl-tRNA(Asn)/glutamyl-tRNA(Gln) amidotransferase subunit A
VSELASSSLVDLARRVGEGEIRCADVVRDALERIDAVDGRVAALLRIRPEAALEEAQAADRDRSTGKARSALHGLPLVIKDNLVSPDFEVTCASNILAGFRAPYEATVLRKLRDAGLVVLGCANMDEFAMGSSCENSAVGPTKNPWDLERIPGGSSGGSAAAVAARMVPAALGSDTGGSIRQPAAHCGVVGLKPTYGRVSRYGLVAFASSLDQIGPIARSVEDAAVLLGVIAGHDPKDSTSVDRPVPDYVAALTGDLSGVRVGIPTEFFDHAGADAGTLAWVRQAIAVLEDAGAKTLDVSLPTSPYGVAAYYLICTAEASSNLSRYDGVKYGFRAEADDFREMYRQTRSKGFGAEVKRRILLGTFVLSAGYFDAYYTKAQKVRTLVRRDFERVFEQCDVVATPTTPGPPQRLGELLDDPLRMYLEDVFTVTVNLAGLPGVSVPCGFSDEGLPVGLQLIAPALAEEMLLRVGDAFQRRTDWHERAPELQERK